MSIVLSPLEQPRTRGDGMANLTVGVQAELTEVADQLQEAGFNVVDIRNPQANFSAMVYSSNIESEAENVREEYAAELGDVPLSATTGSGEGFVLMLNAAEMSTEEIVARIKGL